jgi:hypothetical protein
MHRSRPFVRLAVSVVVIGCSLAACDGGPSPADRTPTSTGSPPKLLSPSKTPQEAESTPLPVASGPCANAYFPVAQGSRWLYERTNGLKVSRFRQIVEDVTDRGFTILLDHGATGTREVWTCSSDGLARVDQFETGPGGGPPPPGTVTFRHRRSEGVTVPADPTVGSSWTQVVTSFAHFVAGGVRYTEKQVATTSYLIVGETSITTAAGTFDALEVETVYRTRKTAPEYGTGIDQRFLASSTQWWVNGVGLVRLAYERPRVTNDLVAYRAA